MSRSSGAGLSCKINRSVDSDRPVKNETNRKLFKFNLGPDRTITEQLNSNQIKKHSPITKSFCILRFFFQIIPERIRTHFSFFPVNGFAEEKYPYRSRPPRLRRSLSRTPAAMTLEAAMALPLFIFMMYLLLFPLKVMEAERKLQNTMETVGKRLASLEYVESVSNSFIDGSSYGDFIHSAADGIEEGAGLAVILFRASEGPFRNAVFSSDTAVFSKEDGADQNMFYAELEYELDLPFSVFCIIPVRKSLVVSRRAWTGSAGGRGKSKYDADAETEEEEDRIVYLGKTSTVYHEDPNCHYLSNVLYTADASAMGGLRNDSGGKYHACPSCKPGKSGTVYYFSSGTAYHSSESCKAITSYSRAVHLSEVGDMRACSYCGKKH